MSLKEVQHLGATSLTSNFLPTFIEPSSSFIFVLLRNPVVKKCGENVRALFIKVKTDFTFVVLPMHLVICKESVERRHEIRGFGRVANEIEMAMNYSRSGPRKVVPSSVFWQGRIHMVAGGRFKCCRATGSSFTTWRLRPFFERIQKLMSADKQTFNKIIFDSQLLLPR